MGIDMATTFYACSRCEQATPTGDGATWRGRQVCPDCADIVLFWETLDAELTNGGDVEE